MTPQKGVLYRFIVLKSQNILTFSANLVKFKAKECVKRYRFYVVLKTECFLRYSYGIRAIISFYKIRQTDCTVSPSFFHLYRNNMISDLQKRVL